MSFLFLSFCECFSNRLFRHFYVYKNDKRVNAVKNGRLSCAFFVSFILHNFDLIKQSHLTVKSTIKDMQKSGWTKIKKPKKGAVIVWQEKIGSDGQVHKHIGFYVSYQRVISNSFKKRTPILHHWTFGLRSSKTYRQITDIFWHHKLNN